MNLSDYGLLFTLSCPRPLGWCQQREKIDWQEPRKFDCRLVRMLSSVNFPKLLVSG